MVRGLTRTALAATSVVTHPDLPDMSALFVRVWPCRSSDSVRACPRSSCSCVFSGSMVWHLTPGQKNAHSSTIC
jgi:hypothetical protein